MINKQLQLFVLELFGVRLFHLFYSLTIRNENLLVFSLAMVCI